MSLSQWIRRSLFARTSPIVNRKSAYRPLVERLEDRTVPTVNQAPVTGSLLVTLAEDSVYQFAESDFNFSDPNDSPANNFLNLKVISTPNSGTLRNGSTVLAGGDFVSVADINAGLLTFTPDADYAGSDGFYLAVQDDGGTAGGGEDTSIGVGMTLVITPINDAPDFTGSDVIVDEDAGAVSIPYWATFNPGGGGDEVTQTANYFVSTPSNPGLFTQLPAVDSEGNLTFTLADDAHGITGFLVQVQDSGGTELSSSKLFVITVNPVNDAPDFTASDVTVDEDASAVTLSNWATFTPGGGSDEASQTATYTVSNISNPSLFAQPPSIDSAGNLTFTLAADANGTTTFDVQVSDGTDVSTVKTFTITVNAVNDAPTFTGSDVTVDEDAGAVTIPYWATFNPGGGSDEATQSPTYIVTNISDPSLFTQLPAVDSAGNLAFTLAADANGTATFDVQVQDNGGTANGGVDSSSVQTFTINVNPVNDAPDFLASDPPTITDYHLTEEFANWATFLPGGGTDEAVQTPTYTVTNVSDPALFSTLPTVDAAGKLAFAFAAYANGIASFDVTADDGAGGTSATKTFFIQAARTTRAFEVNCINDTPDANPNDNQPFDANGDISLRSAIEEGNRANAGWTIVITFNLPNNSVIQIGQTLELRSAFTISGAVGGGITIERPLAAGTPNFRLLDNLDTLGVTRLNNLTLFNGSALAGENGGALRNGGTMFLTNVTMHSNSAQDGGAINNLGEMVLNNCDLWMNSATRNGGAVMNSGSLRIANGNCFLNWAGNYGGAIYSFGSLLDITGSALFSFNQAVDRGGAIYSIGDVTTITSARFEDNLASIRGGALYVATGNTTLTNVSFLRNRAVRANPLTDPEVGTGGGIYFASGGLTLDGCSFFSNDADHPLDGGRAICRATAGLTITLAGINLIFGSNVVDPT